MISTKDGYVLKPGDIVLAQPRATQFRLATVMEVGGEQIKVRYVSGETDELGPQDLHGLLGDQPFYRHEDWQAADTELSFEAWAWLQAQEKVNGK